MHRLLLLLLNASCCVVLLQVVTFDAGGVSGHANHISLYSAVRYNVCKPLWVPPWAGAGIMVLLWEQKQGQCSLHCSNSVPGCGTWHCGETATALEITYSLFQCPISWDLGNLPSTEPSLLFLSLIPLKYATDHFALLP